MTTIHLLSVITYPAVMVGVGLGASTHYQGEGGIHPGQVATSLAQQRETGNQSNGNYRKDGCQERLYHHLQTASVYQ